jgi:amino acid transporter
MEINNPDKPGPGPISTGKRLFAAGLFVIGMFGSVILRHISRDGSNNVLLWINAIIFIPIGIVCAVAIVRPYFFPKQETSRTSSVLPRRDGLSWAMLADRWRNNLTISILGIIVLIAAVLSFFCLWLQSRSVAIGELMQKLPPGIGLLIVVAISTVATFIGAALLGPKLVKYVTGRMPMGK